MLKIKIPAPCMLTNKQRTRHRLTPTNLAWFRTRRDERGEPLAGGIPVESQFMCQNCDEQGGIYCENGNCLDGKCICHDGYTGPLCDFLDGSWADMSALFSGGGDL